MREIRFPKAWRALVLGPHPDDFDAIAVTLKLLRDNGNHITVAVLTSGASGVEDGFAVDSSVTGKSRIREAEQAASAGSFGLPSGSLAFLRFAEDGDGHLLDNESNAAMMRRCIEEHPAELYFLPHGNDTNLDHQRVYAMSRRILAAIGREALVFLNRDPKTIDMRYDVVTPFGEEDAAWKAALLRLHASQHQRNLNTRGHGFDERILAFNRKTAMELGMAHPYAETFEVVSAHLPARD